MDSLAGVVERIVFQHDETHFMVARLRPVQEIQTFREELTTIVGQLPGVQVGETVRLEGLWVTHQQHGREFRVTHCEPQLPSSVNGIQRYLGSGLIKGIGPVMAGRIVNCFGEETLQVIEKTPERLLEIPGLNRKRMEMIKEAWAAQKEIKALMLFLQSHGVATGLAGRIFRAYGSTALAVVRTDPYCMVKDIRGIGFRTADDLATKLGLPRNSVARYAAGLKHALAQATDDGHVYLPRQELLHRGAELLNCGIEDLPQALAKLLEDREAIQDGEAVYLTPLFLAERHAARRLVQLSTTPSPLLFSQGDASFEWPLAPTTEAIELSATQRSAIGTALREKVCVITGGPGVGKSTTVRGLVAVLTNLGVRFCLTAPTGRAAKRLTETTGQPALTVHRLLQFSPSHNSFTVNEDNPLSYSYVVVDEASMLDIVLFYNLLKAIRPTTHLLLVGDADQLLSVGPGNVLRDVIASTRITVVYLTELFRQARQSRIVIAAHQINAGAIPDLANDRRGDLFFLSEEHPERALDLIADLVARRIPRQYGLKPSSDIQVISPMHRGPLGVTNLNERLQARLNPPRPDLPEMRVGGRIFRPGDRVMQTRNDYDRNVFNGDMGIVHVVDITAGFLEVEFPEASVFPGQPELGSESRVRYEIDDLEDLTHAWAISVHKAQGSEFPCVLLVLLPQHRLMLQRNLLYTALTRAKQLCVIIGAPWAVATAVSTNQVENRFTALTRRIQEELD